LLVGKINGQRHWALRSNVSIATLHENGQPCKHALATMDGDDIALYVVPRRFRSKDGSMDKIELPSG
jgi:hypothetical protein